MASVLMIVPFIVVLVNVASANILGEKSYLSPWEIGRDVKRKLYPQLPEPYAPRDTDEQDMRELSSIIQSAILKHLQPFNALDGSARQWTIPQKRGIVQRADTSINPRISKQECRRICDFCRGMSLRFRALCTAHCNPVGETFKVCFAYFSAFYKQ